jgi:transcriptional activator of cad operon
MVRQSRVRRGGELAQLDARALLLLVYLAEQAGEVVSIEDLLKNVWSSAAVSHDSVYWVVAPLRRQLRDNPKQPTYISTVPRRGYRIVADVSPVKEKQARAAQKRADRSQTSVLAANGVLR